MSGGYTLQENTTIDGQVITSGQLVFKAQYICSMQVDNNLYSNQQPKHLVITFPTRIILHPQLEVNVVAYFHAIPKSICTSTRAY